MRIDYKDYRAYLRSDEWKAVKKRYYRSKLYKGHCYCCENPDVPLQIHHKSYNRLKRENLHDLLPLCGDCHEKVHLIVKDKENRSTLWGAARRLRKNLGN
ncbi:hypothetical protein LCGC14_0351700 [marine sediment metagenome]|uniref:HNH nuclease domain-containing protein n=1 Tax=marine sediment metagenome TaxID=412755 RepID=A0A0F9VY15_9ZZZZ